VRMEVERRVKELVGRCLAWIWVNGCRRAWRRSRRTEPLSCDRFHPLSGSRSLHLSTHSEMVATLRLDGRVAIITGALPPSHRRASTPLTCPPPQAPESKSYLSSDPSQADHLHNSGIGLESALVFAGEGAHVVCADINKAAADRAVELIAQMEGAHKAIAVVADVGKEADIKAMVAKAVEEFGRLDVML
jgi:hypothetical protein